MQANCILGESVANPDKAKDNYVSRAIKFALERQHFGRVLAIPNDVLHARLYRCTKYPKSFGYRNKYDLIYKGARSAGVIGASGLGTARR